MRLSIGSSFVFCTCAGSEGGHGHRLGEHRLLQGRHTLLRHDSQERQLASERGSHGSKLDLSLPSGLPLGNVGIVVLEFFVSCEKMFSGHMYLVYV